ncbi:hypothetical protein AB0B15_41745 [Streptomyces sp. NPDC045456]|uniref:hypothetical protein n=1 Tax=Streptomyces sp. NPDC045456 TaxID=3155254 RepID=UPI0033F6A1EF
MPKHQFGRMLHEIVAETKDFLDEIITAFEKYEGFSSAATGARGGTDRKPTPAAADDRRADQLDKLRAELDRLRAAVEEAAGQQPSEGAKTPGAPGASGFTSPNP